MRLIGINNHPFDNTVFSMGCQGNPTDHYTNHRYRLTAIPLTRYPLKRIEVRGVLPSPFDIHRLHRIEDMIEIRKCFEMEEKANPMGVRCGAEGCTSSEYRHTGFCFEHLHDKSLIGCPYCNKNFSTFSHMQQHSKDKHGKEIQDSKAALSTLCEESFSNIRTVKAFATEVQEAKQVAKENKIIYDIGVVKAYWGGSINLVIMIFIYGAMIVLIYYGA